MAAKPPEVKGRANSIDLFYRFSTVRRAVAAGEVPAILSRLPVLAGTDALLQHELVQ